MLIPAILVSIVALLAAMDEQLFGASMMARPLFTGPIIGLIMGDLQTGVIIGATLESMFHGIYLWLEVLFHRKYMLLVF